MKRCLIPLLFVVGAQAADVKQIFLPERHVRGNVNIEPVQPIDEAAWIWLPGHDEWGAATLFSGLRPVKDSGGTFVRFRKEFTADGTPLRIDVSADERFVLLLDGVEIARGPHRGMPSHWNYQSYEISGLEPGGHLLEAVCWQIGRHAPLAQLSVRGGFVLKASGAYDAQLTTGKAEWSVARLVNTKMTDKGSSQTFGAGDQCEAVGTSFLDERPETFVTAQKVRRPVQWSKHGIMGQGWMLFPTTIPDQMHERKTPGRVRKGPDVLAPGFTVPPNTTMRAYWDMENYYCAYPELTVRGGKGATVRWGWTESLRNAKGEKGDRAAVEGKEFTVGFVDTFRADGRPRGFFTAPWWRCGRWCMIEVTTADEPLVLEKVEIAETRYPTPPTAEFKCSDTSLDAVQRICVRGLQMCMHEMFFDCPYYEQQMYPGDSRVEYLAVGALNSDDRLIRHAISLFDWDRRENGLIAMNFPTRGTQESSTYTLCWLLMLRDYMMNHADAAWLKARLPGMNHTLMGMALYEGPDGLLRNLPGWSFMDWVPEWRTSPMRSGVAPDGESERPCALNNLFYLYAMRGAAEIEEAVGEHELAAHWRTKATRLAQAISAAFWDDARGLMADTLKKDVFSEHAQCLAILTDALSPEQRTHAFKGLVEAPGLFRTTVYFTHYLFDTYFAMGRPDLFMKRLDMWREFVKLNLCTPLETPSANWSRSDCHAWSSHPLYHLHTGVLGVRSAAPFFAKVRIAPQPADLKWIKAKTPHPMGLIESDLTFAEDRVSGSITLPGDLSGTFEWKGKSIPLHPGRNSL